MTENKNNNNTLTRRDFLKLTGLYGFVTMGLKPMEKLVNLDSLHLHLDEPTINKYIKEDLHIKNQIDTPPSLMLHSAGEKQITKLAPILAEKYTSITYREFYALMAQDHDFSTEKPPLLISIDDPGTGWLNPAYKRMVDTMTKHGLVGTLAVVTTGEQKMVDPEIWKYFKEIQKSGWEIAIHTEDHLILPKLSDEETRYQISECYNNIGEGTGIYPTTLILPFGLVAAEDKLDQPTEYNPQIFKVCKDLNIRFVVGIPYGKTFTGESPYFVGRIPPHKDDITITLQWLEDSFVQDGSRKIISAKEYRKNQTLRDATIPVR